MVLSLRELVNEDWWDDMSPEDQAAYIKKHPGSKQAQSAKDDAQQKGMDKASDLAKKGLTKGPGGYGDRGNVRGGDQRNFGEPDDEEYFKSMMGGGDEDDYDMGEVPGSRGTGPWTPEDDPDFEHGPSLTSAPGRVPDEDSSERLEQIAQEKAALEQEMEDAEARGDKAAYADADEKLYDLEQEEEELGGGGEPDEIDLGKPYPDGNAPPKTSMVDRFSSQEHLDNSLEQQKQYQSHLNKWAEEAADNDDDETLAKIQELDDENKKEIERLEKDGAKGMYRTGNELNQETLTIDGKQYRRISEGVEKQPKPKYEFSEFYQRFKR